jgi:hypothetical protein
LLSSPDNLMILLPQPYQWLGLQACSTISHIPNPIFFLLNIVSRQTGRVISINLTPKVCPWNLQRLGEFGRRAIKPITSYFCPWKSAIQTSWILNFSAPSQNVHRYWTHYPSLHPGVSKVPS